MLFEGTLFFVLSCILTIFAQNIQDGTIVNLQKGKIRGVIRKSENGNDYYAFQEIPYAAPPVGSNRYQLPQEPDPWDDVLNTTKNTNICYPQTSKSDSTQFDEDCLYLNVYTPIKRGTATLLPVLFWIHGGALVSGSGIYDLYGPKYIMDHGVVVVTINYRLGAFGFVGTHDGVIPLNLGLKDQRFALEWVHENIYSFGGNPNKVTIAGESAGSRSVGYHLMTQKPDENLFQAAIMQSGSPFGAKCKESNPTSLAFNLGKLINNNFSSTNSSELLILLQSTNASDLIANYHSVTGGISIEKEGLYTSTPYQTFLDRNYKKVPVLIGFNSEEMIYLVSDALRNYTLLKEIDKDPSLLILNGVNISPKNRLKFGMLYKQIYTNGSFEDNYAAFIRYSSDSNFVTPISKQVEISCKDAPHYYYQFAYKGILGEEMDLLPLEGAETVGHAEDVHYMWEDRINNNLSQFSEADGLMLHRFVKMWTNFVKYFNPTPRPDPLLFNITWLTTEPNTLRYLNINSTFEMREHPRHYMLVKKLLDEFIEPPFDSYA